MKITSRLSGLLIIALTASVCLTCLCFTGQAQASYEDPPVKLGAEAGNLESSTEYLLENSPRKITGIESTPQSEALYETVTEPPPEADPAIEEELATETPTLLEETGIWDWLLAPSLLLPTAAGWAGWEIGSYIYGTYLAGEVDEPGERDENNNIEIPTYGWFTIPAGLIYSTEAGDFISPAFGFMSFEQGWTTDTGHCQVELVGQGTRLFNTGIEEEVVGWFGMEDCAHAVHEYRLYKPWNVVRCGAPTACPGIEPIPYEGEGQATAPTPEALRETLKEKLESNEYPELNRLYNYEQEPEAFPDPRITEKKVDDKERRCDRGTPSFENPGGNVSPEPFAKKEESSFSVTTRPEGYEAPPVYLRWGTTYWKPGREGFEGTSFLDDWGGWGWRHIIAKHGWSALDREETEVALDIGTPQPTAKEGKYVYEAPDVEPGSGGVECIRKVVVDFATGEEDPAPRGIVTSYNVVK